MRRARLCDLLKSTGGSDTFSSVSQLLIVSHNKMDDKPWELWNKNISNTTYSLPSAELAMQHTRSQYYAKKVLYAGIDTSDNLANCAKQLVVTHKNVCTVTKRFQFNGYFADSTERLHLLTKVLTSEVEFQ